MGGEGQERLKCGMHQQCTCTVTKPDIKLHTHSSTTHYMFMLGDPHAMDVLFMETISSPACDCRGNCYEKVQKMIKIKGVLLKQYTNVQYI